MIIWVSVVPKGIVVQLYVMITWMTESFTINNNSP